MKTVPAALSTALRSAYNLYARPRLTVEWNLNRYYTVTADNVPAETDYGYDTEFFPIEDITKPNRPTKGILKGRADAMYLADSDPLKQNARWYICDDTNTYKYWTSPVPTDSSGNFPTYTAAWATAQDNTGDPLVDNQTVVRPFINYSTVTKANKIIIKTENSWATPNAYSVLIKTTTNGAWTSIATTGLDNSTGQLTLWWNGTTWVTTKPTGTLTTTNVAGVMFSVTSMTAGRDLSGNVTTYTNNGTTYNTTGANAYFELIEIAAALEADLSNKLISVSDTFDMGEHSLIYPIGTTTANTAQITLSNLYTDAEIGAGSGTTYKAGLFNPSNTASPYQNLAEQNAKFNLEYVFTVSGADYAVQQFEMYSGPWNATEDDQITLDLRDYSKFFDEDTPEALFWMGRSVTEIIWRLCDSLGFVKYAVGVADNDESPVIPYFWTDGEKTMWEICNDLSVATQTAIYFDAWGVLQIRSRNHAFNKARAIDWTLRSEIFGTELPDIISMEQTGEAQTNSVTISYYSSDLTDWSQGSPKLTKVWEPDGTVALRAAVLKKSITAGDTVFIMSSTDAEVWPYSGIVQVEGELIRYDAKEYSYTDSGGTPQTAWCENLEDWQKLEKNSLATAKYKNHWTGRFRVTERGLWNSEAKAHQVEALGYSVRRIVNGNRDTGVGGFKHQPTLSTVRMTSTPQFKRSNDLLIATRGNEADSNFWYFGCRMRFKKSSQKDQKAGIVFNNQGTNELGYYVELQASDKVDRKQRQELIVYTRASGALDKKLGGNGGKGRATNVATDRWYDIDIFYKKTGGNESIQVAINGKPSLDVNVPSGNDVPVSGKFGMFLRGDTDVEFEYLYGIRQPQGETMDESTFWDRVNGGYLGSQWDSEWVYNTGKVIKRKKKSSNKQRKKWNLRYMDEFGPWLHEVREFDVKFEPRPVLHTKLMFSSDEALCPEYHSGSFGAQFILANKSRRNVIVNGDDAEQYTGTGDSVNNVLMIFGRDVQVSEAQTVVKTNDAQIKIKGKIESEIDSPWIQSESAANKLGQWINDHWSTGADEIDVEVFGNPLFEIGDVVGVEYQDRFMTAAAYKYFVVSITTNWNNGIQTSMSLRRVT